MICSPPTVDMPDRLITIIFTWQQSDVTLIYIRSSESHTQKLWIAWKGKPVIIKTLGGCRGTKIWVCYNICKIRMKCFKDYFFCAAHADSRFTNLISKEHPTTFKFKVLLQQCGALGLCWPCRMPLTAAVEYVCGGAVGKAVSVSLFWIWGCNKFIFSKISNNSSLSQLAHIADLW